MPDKKVTVPDGMLRAAMKAFAAWQGHPEYEFYAEGHVRNTVEAALEWLSEHPILPIDEWVEAAYDGMSGKGHVQTIVKIMDEWQRRMFIARHLMASSPPGPIDDLLYTAACLPKDTAEVDQRIGEAYARGLKRGSDVRSNS